MTKTWLFGVALAIAICGEGTLAQAQGPGPSAGGLPDGSYYQVSPTGQTYLMVPGSQQRNPNELHTAAYLGGEGCVTGNGAACDKAPCDKNCCCDKCAGICEGWCHCVSVFGGFMYLRARDSEVAWATAANGPIVPGGVPVQVSPIAVLDQDFQPGFFVGVGFTLDECSSLSATYTQFESTTTNGIAGAPTAPVVASILHPSTIAGDSTYLFGNARYGINFNLLDIDYRQLFYGECGRKANYLIGARMAQSEQKLDAEFAVLGTASVATDIDFVGAGIRFGLEYEQVGRRGFMVYGRAVSSFVPGEFRANYRQQASFDNVVVDTGWTAGRLVTMVDLEVGVGWSGCCDRFRVSAGYLVSSWFNTVQTDEWIHGVQTNNFIDMSSMTTFDGFMLRAEVRF